MQTIKTAAVLFLMLSVVVGVGLSLTAPPEELPPEVEQLLLSDDTTSPPLDDLLPPSLAELGIDDGTMAQDGSGGRSDNLSGVGSRATGEQDPLAADQSRPMPASAVTNAMIDRDAGSSSVANTSSGFTASLSDS